MVNIKVIAGSTRPGRFNPQVAGWVMEKANKHKDVAKFELLDLADINLPLLDEANTPMSNQKENEHTIKWAEMIEDADGFIVVAPEYNHSIPAALKNAFDYLFHEWHYKPVTYVSYGSAAGGARSVEHLRGVAGELKMYDLREQLLLPNYWNDMNERGEYQFTDEHKSQLNIQLESIVYWAEVMKPARENLKSKSVK